MCEWESDIHLPFQNSHCPKLAGYFRFCQEKFDDGLPTIEEMQQPVYLRELLSAARHAKRIGMTQEEFVCFEAESFNKDDSNCQGMCGLTAFAKYNFAQEFDNKEESTDDHQISKKTKS